MPSFNRQRRPGSIGEASAQSASPVSTEAQPPSPWRIVGIYTTVAMLWIFGSDRVLALLYAHPEDIIRWSVYKGLVFVTVTAALLLVLVRRAFRSIELGHRATQAKEQALQASEAQLGDIIGAAMDAIVAVDSERRIVGFNPAAERMFGCTDEIAAGRPIADFIPDLVEGACGTGLELHARRMDGVEIPVEASISRSVGHQVTSFTAFLRDISARRQAEEVQREQAVLWANAQRIGQMGSWSFHVPSGVLLWSEATCALFGIAQADFRGTLAHFYEFVPAEDRQILHAAAAEASPAQPLIEVEYRIRRPDGALRWMYERGVVEFDGGLPVRQLGMVMDITERREDKLALQHTLDELGRRNRELEEFAYVASHDLQEPLRKIRTFSEILMTRSRPHLDDAGCEYLDRMARAATRMQALIDDLLEYSRIATGSRPSTQVNLMTICREVLADLDARVESTQARLHVADLPRITADAVGMRQMFQNLIGNALKFSSPARNPEISISCAPATLGDEAALQIVFADNGIGFDPKFAEKIFNPFQRLHSRTEHEGTGMGLAIVRRVVERHGGTIRGVGTPGEGACFTVTLPLGAELRRPPGG